MTLAVFFRSTGSSYYLSIVTCSLRFCPFRLTHVSFLFVVFAFPYFPSLLPSRVSSSLVLSHFSCFGNKIWLSMSHKLEFRSGLQNSALMPIACLTVRSQPMSLRCPPAGDRRHAESMKESLQNLLGDCFQIKIYGSQASGFMCNLRLVIPTYN